MRKGSLFNCLASGSKSCLIISCLLLTCAGVAEGRKNDHVRCSSSCGHLHDISDPFRLKSDRPGCGSKNYEILCVDGGKPMLELGSAKYYVTNISYTDKTISLVDPVFVNDDKYCLLPLQSPPAYLLLSVLFFQISPDDYPYLADYHPYLYATAEKYWALFVNCTRPIQDDTYTQYQRVPCLSSNNSFVYVVLLDWEPSVGSIKPSCGFLATVPINVGDAMIPNPTDIFELLKEGFILSWIVPARTPSAKFHRCLKDAKSLFAENMRGKGILPNWTNAERIISTPFFLVVSEVNFIYCMNELFSNNHYFRFAVAVVVVIEIVQLLLGKPT